ncbi:hypothetical protein MNBD_BACTEROID01-168 [hydrothermal vent metagenome]|uniref:DUF4249 domain-containing protein n=1 Tax=hydrothermal vent metagenome TaxID=652676 RepID=A0A3B0T277_9ZZZZ
MKIKFINYKILALLLMLISCQEQIEISLPQINRNPVVNCWLNANGSYIFHLSFPTSANSNSIQVIDSAKVFILSDNKVDTLFHTKNGFYCNSSFSPSQGKPYKLEVKIDNYKNLYSIDSIPQTKINISAIEYRKDYKIDEEGDEYSEIRVSITDIHEGNDYFGISVQSRNGKNGFYSHQITSYSPEIMNELGMETYPNILVFKDDLFENASTKLKIRFYDDKATYVKIYSFSFDAYKYIKSWIIHDYTKEYDFWEVYEPVPLYSNIENGYGIFAGYSSQLLEVYPDSTVTF